MLLTHLIHHVIDGDDALEPPEGIDDRYGDEVVLVKGLDHRIHGVALVEDDGIGEHHVPDLADGGIGDDGLRRQDADQSLQVIDDVDVVDLVQLLGLTAHLVEAHGHGPIGIHHDHLLPHHTTGGVLIVVEEVDDIARLLQVRDMGEDRILPLAPQVADQVGGIVGIHILDDLRGDLLLRHEGEDLTTPVLVHLGDDVRHLDIREHPEGTRRILIGEVVDEGGDVGRVHRMEGALQLSRIVGLEVVTELFRQFGGQFDHLSVSSSLGQIVFSSTAAVRAIKSSTSSCSGRIVR